MSDLTTLLNRGNADLVYLVEFNARKLVDGSLEPLYFSKKPVRFSTAFQFIPAISTLSDLDRAANDTMDPAYLPTWGDISFFITGAYKPDAENTIPWNLLLYKDTYTFAGQSMVIKIGAAGDAYASFTTIFSGQIGEVSWTDAELNFTIYDKAQELETKYPDYELPESEQVDEESWDQAVPIIIGQVQNYSPVYFNTISTDYYPLKFALACHVIEGPTAVYFFGVGHEQGIPGSGWWNWTQKDISPPKKDTIYGGSAIMSAYGPYTGTLYRASWLIRITAGSEVGLATFKWSMDRGVTWEGTGLVTSEIPIPLADGVSVKWTPGLSQDFYVGDEWTFILYSSLETTGMPDASDITVDAKGLINPATNLFADTIGQMIYSLLRIFPEWADADIDLASITAFDVAIPYAAGLAIDSPDSITSIITQLLTGIPAIFSITNAGKFFLQELIAPAGTPVLVVTDEHIMDLPTFVQLPDITKRVYLEYDRNYTTNSGSSLSSNITQARLAWLKRGNRQISRKDDSILANYPMASDIGPLETVLIDRADAALLAAKLLTLYQLPHETMTIEIGLQAARLNIGAIVEVRRDKFSQDAGQLYKVIGTNINFTDRLSEVTLWR